ncbi:MAG TPA: nucleoside monophosphate kinase [Acidimicrobiales bacterium]|nr:nucleoside monophosphate kinase [Acidimicrobiales bacterium]
MGEPIVRVADSNVTVGPKVIVLGRQGSGKGTQCARLAEHLAIPHISTGDLFRAAIAADTGLGRRAKAFVDRGALVPDELVLDLVASHLGGVAARRSGYLLDGFPRTLAQGQALFEVLGAGAADLAVELHVPTEVVVPRLAARRVCRDCGAVTAAPDGVTHHLACSCGGIATRRDDDTDEAIARRLALYDEESAPLLLWLGEEGLLVTVDGVGTPEEVFARLDAAVQPRLARLRATTTRRSERPT